MFWILKKNLHCTRTPKFLKRTNVSKLVSLPATPQGITTTAATYNQAHRKGHKANKKANIVNNGSQGAGLISTAKLCWISLYLIYSFLHQIIHKYHSILVWDFAQFWAVIFLYQPFQQISNQNLNFFSLFCVVIL